MRLESAVKASRDQYLLHGARSDAKLKPLHGWVIEELREGLGKNYTLAGKTLHGGAEMKVGGRYYPKNVDVAISRDGMVIGVVSVKFVQSNYRQNKNNYFEQQLGETANLRSSDIVFGQIMLFPEPIPYFSRNSETRHTEHVTDDVIERYAKLAQDHSQHHVPEAQCMAIFLLDEERRRVLRICKRSDLPKVSAESFSLLTGKLGIYRFFEEMTAAVKAKYMKRRS